MTQRTKSSTPTVGTRWRRADHRGVWTVQSVGRKYIYLKCSVPGLTKQLDIVMWPGDWRPA